MFKRIVVFLAFISYWFLIKYMKMRNKIYKFIFKKPYKPKHQPPPAVVAQKQFFNITKEIVEFLNLTPSDFKKVRTVYYWYHLVEGTLYKFTNDPDNLEFAKRMIVVCQERGTAPWTKRDVLEKLFEWGDLDYDQFGNLFEKAEKYIEFLES